LHRQVGFVFQDSILFNLTLRDNIAFSIAIPQQQESSDSNSALTNHFDPLKVDVDILLVEELLFLRDVQGAIADPGDQPDAKRCFWRDFFASTASCEDHQEHQGADCSFSHRLSIRNTFIAFNLRTVPRCRDLKIHADREVAGATKMTSSSVAIATSESQTSTGAPVTAPS
jgi:ABC-type sugar transport system ATPase subunit